jgi:hypothetical protein
MSNVLFKRSTDVNSIPIIDGQVIFDELDNKIYMDNGNQRLQYGGDVSLISNIDYATANNAFSALATKNIFLRQNSVVDNKDSILAATEGGLPAGCLGIQSIIGNSNYSAIGNTVSSALLTLNNNINNVNTKFTNQLKANSHDIYMDYKNGKYGYNTSPSRGADTFHPFSGYEYLGEGTSFNLSNRPDYTTLTNSNFLVRINGISQHLKVWNYSAVENQAEGWKYPSIPYPSYNSTTGQLTILNTVINAGSPGGSNLQDNTLYYTVGVYLFTS